jgi:hypothetical protein
MDSFVHKILLPHLPILFANIDPKEPPTTKVNKLIGF